MSDLWNKEAFYIVRSKDEKYRTEIEYWEVCGQKGISIEIKDEEQNLLHFFSIVLTKDKRTPIVDHSRAKRKKFALCDIP